MRKKFLTIAFILIFAASLLSWPSLASAVDETSFTQDTTIILDNGLSFIILANSLCDQMVVNSSNVVFTLSGNSTITAKSSDRYRLINSLGVADCETNANYSQIVLPAQGSSTDVTVTPSTTLCSWGSSGGSGGGGGGGTTTTTTTTKPTTTTGQVTATSSAGGKTTFTTTEAGTATVELPASAVTSSTTINVSAETKSSATVSRPLPSGKSVPGGYVYNFTATAGTTSVTTFSKDITLTFTYTDSQITGINEDTLKAYYWDGTQWKVLTSTLDKVNNKVTVTTNHFTYFVIMGDATTTTTMAKPSDYGLKEGDLIRATGDFDIFIISQNGYKRLFLNPTIFNMYGHLGGWSKVKAVTTATRDAFVTSHYYRYVDSSKVYQMKVTGEDTGTLHWVNMTAENFLAQGGKGEAVFIINKSEYDWYAKGADITSLK